MISSLISPKIGLTLIKSQIEKQLNKKVDKFDIILMMQEKSICFRIEGKKYLHDNDQLKTILETQLSQHIPKDVNLEMIIISYESENVEVKTMYLEDQKPVTKISKL